MGALARVWVPWGVPGWAHLKGGRTAPDASRLFLCCAWYLPASFFCVFSCASFKWGYAKPKNGTPFSRGCYEFRCPRAQGRPRYLLP